MCTCRLHTQLAWLHFTSVTVWSSSDVQMLVPGGHATWKCSSAELQNHARDIWYHADMQVSSHMDPVRHSGGQVRSCRSHTLNDSYTHTHARDSFILGHTQVTHQYSRAGGAVPLSGNRTPSVNSRLSQCVYVCVSALLCLLTRKKKKKKRRCVWGGFIYTHRTHTHTHAHTRSHRRSDFGTHTHTTHTHRDTNTQSLTQSQREDLWS